MTANISEIVQSCSQYSRNSIIEEPRFVREYPWRKIGIDIADLPNYSYLVVKDFFSKWVSCVQLESKTIYCMIDGLKIIFSHLGIPEIIVLDYLPFCCYRFKHFAEQFNIELRFINSIRTNGTTVSGVKIVRSILKKHDDLLVGLINYNNTPLSSLKISPAALMHSRQLRSINPRYLEEAAQQKRRPLAKTQLLEWKKNRKLKFYSKDTNSRPHSKDYDDVYAWKDDDIVEDRPAKNTRKSHAARLHRRNKRNVPKKFMDFILY